VPTSDLADDRAQEGPVSYKHAERMLACALAGCARVSGLTDMLGRVRAALFAEPDHALVRARVASERLVAAVRLGIIVFFSVANALFYLAGKGDLFSLVVPLGALLYGTLLFILPRRSSAAWIPWLVSTTDVTLASLVIWSYAIYGFPLAAVNNKVMFEWYFVAVTLAALRFDWRLCALTTGLALTQFLGIFAYVASHENLSTLTSTFHGVFIPMQFVGRLSMLAGHGVGTIAVAMWARHLRLMVGTDQLTGLLQRRPFYERIEEELQRADAARTNLSIAIFDVDEFKQFNDKLGHLEGDRALQRIGEQLRKAVRTTDLVSRYGGEEFVIAFPRMDVQLATRRAEALRAEIAALELGAGDASLTISGGVASWPADGQTFEEVLKRADERLYGAKAAGRNLVIGPRPVPLRSAGDLGA
jgi:diguanylate cyclase (GGDEF)-like protein